MGFGLFTLFTAICISGVAAWYSIVGLMAIFASAKLAIAIMGAVLEVGKLVTACWVYQNWHTCPKLLRTYLTCLLYTSPSPRDRTRSRMPSSA